MRDHRDTGVDGCLDRVAERIGIRDRDDDAVWAGGDRGVDQLGHRDHVEGVSAPGTRLDAHVLGGLIDAVLDNRPERVGRLTMADDHEPQAAAIRTGILAQRSGADPDKAKRDQRE